jgi:AbrB family looped-hinge helix DNA binding protein
MTTSITQKGQITIPIEFRRRLGLKTGSRCIFMVRDNELVLVPVKKDLNLDELRDLLAKGLSSSKEFMARKKEEKALEL